MSSFSLQDNAELQPFEQNYGHDPLADRESDLYRGEFVKGFVKKWDELIDWDARAESEGQYFIDVLRARGKESVLDAATGTGFHSARLTEAGFDVLSVDGSATMLAKAFENGQKRGLILNDRPGRLARAEPQHPWQVRRHSLPRQLVHALTRRAGSS
jgi:glycine/sarcosine/dimethylglycine N-methyltransferase